MHYIPIIGHVGDIVARYVIVFMQTGHINAIIIVWYQILCNCDSTVSAWLGLISAVQHTGDTTSLYTLDYPEQLWFPLK